MDTLGIAVRHDPAHNYISRPCAICGVTIRVTSLQHKYCGEACAEVARQRAEAEKLPGKKKFKDPNYHPVNNVQRAMHKSAMRKRNR